MTARNPQPRRRAPASLRPAPRIRTELQATEAIPRVLKILGTIVAPTTLLTALLFYFGRLHITAMFRYLGVNFTVLDLSFQDYLIRSADGLFVPLAAAAGMVLAILWIHSVVVRVVPAPARRVIAARAAPVVAIGGFLLIALPVAYIAGVPVLGAVPELRGLCLAVGILLLSAGTRPLRRERPASVVVAEWGSVFVVVSVGLFWAVGDYAAGVGTSRGQQLAALASTPDVMLRSDRDLGIVGPGVTAKTCGDPKSPSGHRYSGLRLVIQSSGQLLLLPAGWTVEGGGAVVVPRTDEIQLEFVSAGTAGQPSC